MCGIAGFGGFQNDKLIHQLSADLAHRGPDGEGFYIGEKVSLMNRRLAIIDREGGDQPIYNEDKSIVVVYNGEIYNYQVLKQELEKYGHTFKTKSDTEVIVHGYEQWGKNCFDKFNGMFGVALYDIKKSKLVLARDHFGIKPLYFVNGSGRIIFSSELKPILNSGLIAKKVNERVLYRYLKYRVHDDGRETFFEGINRLLPGEVLTYQNGKFNIEEYSTLKKDINSHDRDRDTTLTENEIFRFKEMLVKSVKMRLMSEVPVGTALSGGLDSSTVVAIINNLLNERVKESSSVGSKQNTFSAVFPGSVNDEERYIDALLVKSEHIKSHKVYPKPEEFFNDLTDFIRTQEEPTISTGPYAQYQVMREAKKYVTVLLDGQGADEMMAGYLPYYFVYLNQLKREGNYLKLLKEIWSSRDVLTKYFYSKLLQSVSIKTNIQVSSVLNNKFVNKHHNETFKITSDNLKQRLFEDIFANSLQSLLRYEDRNTMRFSLEGRVPFLDFNLLRYIFSLPVSAIIENGFNKNILRKSVKGLVPEIIVNRRNKIGFTTPEQEWFLRMKNRIYDIFMSESFVNRPYFNQPEVIKAFQKFIEGKTDDTLLFWRLLNVEMWMREFLDSPLLKTSEGQDVKREYKYGEANEGKKIEIEVDGKKYSRYPIKTDVFQKGDNLEEKISKYVLTNINIVETGHAPSVRINNQTSPGNKSWYIVVSEKIVAISQGRSFFIWDVKLGFWANVLCKFVTKTPYGIGLGSPWTMQIAIDEIGLPRILIAGVASFILKNFGRKGVFYKIAGPEIAAIDGPTEYSIYPSNVSAKLAPKNPQKVAESIKSQITNYKQITNNKRIFGGVVIIDANDLGRRVLGNATDKPNAFFEEVMRDNPMGQGSEQTPIAIILVPDHFGKKSMKFQSI